VPIDLPRDAGLAPEVQARCNFFGLCVSSIQRPLRPSPSADRRPFRNWISNLLATRSLIPSSAVRCASLLHLSRCCRIRCSRPVDSWIFVGVWIHEIRGLGPLVASQPCRTHTSAFSRNDLVAQLSWAAQRTLAITLLVLHGHSSLSIGLTDVNFDITMLAFIVGITPEWSTWKDCHAPC